MRAPSAKELGLLLQPFRPPLTRKSPNSELAASTEVAIVQSSSSFLIMFELAPKDFLAHRKKQSGHDSSPILPNSGKKGRFSKKEYQWRIKS